MKIVGWGLFIVGFLAGAFFLVQRLDTVDWVAYGLSGGVCVAGIVLMRWSDRMDTGARLAAEENLRVAQESLSRLVDGVADINRRREEIGVYGIHGELDAKLIDDLNKFVMAREAIIHGYDMDRYARVMDPFAGAERALNRAWSASADGYINEVWACLERAERGFTRARNALADG